MQQLVGLKKRFLTFPIFIMIWPRFLEYAVPMCKIQEVGFVSSINPFESWTFVASVIKIPQYCLVYYVLFLRMAEVHRINKKKAIKQQTSVGLT